MGTLRGELLRFGFGPKIEVTDAEAKAFWEEHLEAHRLLEERNWELALGERMRKHPELGVASIVASMPQLSWQRVG